MENISHEHTCITKITAIWLNKLNRVWSGTWYLNESEVSVFKTTRRWRKGTTAISDSLWLAETVSWMIPKCKGLFIFLSFGIWYVAARGTWCRNCWNVLKRNCQNLHSDVSFFYLKSITRSFCYYELRIEVFITRCSWTRNWFTERKTGMFCDVSSPRKAPISWNHLNLQYVVISTIESIFLIISWTYYILLIEHLHSAIIPRKPSSNQSKHDGRRKLQSDQSDYWFCCCLYQMGLFTLLFVFYFRVIRKGLALLNSHDIEFSIRGTE